MVRHRRLTSDDVFQPLGSIVASIVAVACIAVFLAAVVVMVVAIAVIDWLQDNRFLGPIPFAVMVVVVALHFTGCASPRVDPRDPEIYRPTAPHYPMPEDRR